MVFANFHQHLIQKGFGQIKNMKDKTFSFQLKKITSARRLQMMLGLKMYPFPFI